MEGGRVKKGLAGEHAGQRAMRQLWMSLQKFHVKSGLSAPLFLQGPGPLRSRCSNRGRKWTANLLRKHVADFMHHRPFLDEVISCNMISSSLEPSTRLEYPLSCWSAVFASFSFSTLCPSCVLFCRFRESLNEKEEELADKLTSDKQSALLLRHV